MLALLLCLGVGAEVPLPDYRQELAAQRAWEVQEHIQQGELDEAIASARRYQRKLGEDAQLQYLMGWALSGTETPDQAEPCYRRAVELRPDYTEAWIQLGEFYTRQQRIEPAREAWTAVSQQLTRGERAWLGPLRLAEVAAMDGDAPGLETHLREALRRGFSFKDISSVPRWQAWYADPTLHDSIDKMVTVYGDERTRALLRGEP